MLAEVAELADALRSGRSELYALTSSTLVFGTEAPHGAFFYGADLAARGSLG